MTTRDIVHLICTIRTTHITHQVNKAVRYPNSGLLPDSSCALYDIKELERGQYGQTDHHISPPNAEEDALPPFIPFWVCWRQTSWVNSQLRPFIFHKPQNAALNTALLNTHLARCGSGAAVLGQFQHGPVALAAGGAVEAVRPIVVDPLMVAEVAS